MPLLVEGGACPRVGGGHEQLAMAASIMRKEGQNTVDMDFPSLH